VRVVIIIIITITITIIIVVIIIIIVVAGGEKRRKFAKSYLTPRLFVLVPGLSRFFGATAEFNLNALPGHVRAIYYVSLVLTTCFSLSSLNTCQPSD